MPAAGRSGSACEFFDFRNENDRVEQSGDALTGHGARLDELHIAAHVVGDEPFGVQLTFRAFEVRVRHVHLVDRHDDLDVGSLRVADRFLRLRHHAVGRGNDDHRDIGDVRTTGTHLGERFVAWGVEEGDEAVFLHLLVTPSTSFSIDFSLDRPRTDHLRDAAGLGRNDVRIQAVVLANLVEQRRLAVVDVTHDGDDRRPRTQFLRFHVREQLLEFREQPLFGRFLLLDDQLDVLLDRDQCGRVEVERRVVAVKLASFLEEPLDQFADLHADRFGQAADRDRQRDLDLAFLDDRRDLASHVLAKQSGARPAAGTPLLLDDIDLTARPENDGRLTAARSTTRTLATTVPRVATDDAAASLLLLVVFVVADHARPAPTLGLLVSGAGGRPRDPRRGALPRLTFDRTVGTGWIRCGREQLAA